MIKIQSWKQSHQKIAASGKKAILNFKALFVISLAIGLQSISINAQVITTYAGDGLSGVSGDGGPATIASMNAPWGLAVDAVGNVYVSDIAANRVRKVSPTGIITTFAGNGSGYGGDGGPATAAGISGPTGIATFGTDVFIAENGSSRIRKVNAAGIITTYAGIGIAGHSGDGGPATLAKISTPDGIGVDLAGNIYIPDQGTNYVRKVNTSGIIATIAGNGTSGYSGDGGPATLAQLNLPDEITADPAGNVYFTDFMNNVIRKIDLAGIITTYGGTGVAGFGGDGGPATAALLSGASGINCDASGNIYFADTYNERVRKITPAGIISTIAGSGTAGFSGDGGDPVLAELNYPNTPGADAAGNIYIGEMNNRRIRKITPPITANTPPSFVNGKNQNLIFCQVIESTSAVSIDTLLAVNDPDAGQTETWSSLLVAAHGMATVAYTTISTGSEMIPVGLTYTPTVGYTGNDSFKVVITDGVNWDTTTIHVTINPQPIAGVVNGPADVCKGDSIKVTDVTGVMGIWSTSNAGVSVTATGEVMGLVTGPDTVLYSVTNMCGTAIAMHYIEVNDCNTGISMPANSPAFKIFPNPVSTELTLDWSDWQGGNASVAIKNITGQKVFSISLAHINTINGSAKLDLSLLNEGIYVLTISSETICKNYKIIVSRK